jgi:DNA repair exonuclease SbcCD ATPase subunit
MVLFLLPSVGLAQSLGAAAEKEKQRRKNAAKDSGTTDEDLAKNKGVLANDPSVPVASPPPGAASNRETGDRSSSLEADRQNAERSESKWRARADQARARIRSAEQALKAAEDRLRSVVSSSLQGVGVAPTARSAALQAVNSATRELEAAKKSLEAMEEEARRAGAAPGWLRE